MKIEKITEDEFAKMLLSLDTGEYFDFASSADCDGDPQSESDLEDWYGIQKICLFGNDMFVVSKYGGPGCDAFPADNDCVKLAVDDMFSNMCWSDGVYVIKKTEKRKPSVTLTDSFCLYISGCTNCGENILIPSSKIHDIINEKERRNVVEDVCSRIEEMEDVADFSDGELRQIAEIVIDRRDDCDSIYEIYWQIVEETIKEFSKEKLQNANTSAD